MAGRAEARDEDQPTVEMVACARHPRQQTNLRCARCATPICPQCMVYTPVGARCPDCGRGTRLPTYSVSPLYYVRALAAGLMSAVLIGAIWGAIPVFGFWMALGLGFGTGEAISWASNRKRGLGLQAIAVISVFAGIAISRLVPIAGLLPGLPLGVILTGLALRLLQMGLLGLIIAALAVVVAVVRLR